MSSKIKLSGIKARSNYIIITDPEGGHTGQTAEYITLRQAKKLLKDDSVLVYIFKIPRLNYNGRFLKYPVGEYYDALKINILNEDVWCSFNIESLKKKEKDFSEYIELKPFYDDYFKEWKINIEYHVVEKINSDEKCIICNEPFNENNSYECFTCKKIFCYTHNTKEFICDCK
jgi:hypothetical protein